MAIGSFETACTFVCTRRYMRARTQDAQRVSTRYESEGLTHTNMAGRFLEHRKGLGETLRLQTRS